MLDNIYTPNNTESVGTKHQRIDQNFAILCAAKGSVSLSNGNNIITFSQDIGTTNYMVLRNVFDENNVPVAHILSNKTSSSFSIEIGFSDCVLNYMVVKL